MMRDQGPDLGQLDPLVHADSLGRQIRRERGSAVGALVRTVLDDLIGRLTRLWPSCQGLAPPGLDFSRSLRSVVGWLGGRARRRLGPLQAQHQLDQLFLAQTLKLAAPHPALESAQPISRWEAHPRLKNVRTFVVLKHLKRSLAIPLSILTGTSGAG